MIFSIFGRKEGRPADRSRGSSPEAGTGRPVVPGRAAASARSDDPREVARRTAAKIDEIESEMIAAARATPASPVRADPGAMEPTPDPGAVRKPVAASSRPAPTVMRSAPGRVSPGPAGRAPDGGAVAATRVPDVGVPGAGAVAAGPGEAIGRSVAADGGDVETRIEITSGALSPSFEEAAVLYSNGQGAAAAMILWETARGAEDRTLARQAWAMLFDLYQATGRRTDFDSLALDFSTRFETSPPTWDDALAPPPEDTRPTGVTPGLVTMPAVLDAQAVRQLEQAQRLAQRRRAVLLDLSGIRSVDPVGADLLRRLLDAFARSRRELWVQGADALLGVLARSTEPGRRDPSEACWLLQMDLLRLQDRQQAFEDLAIDYCVTYEVSPPSWEPMPASIRAAVSVDTEPVDRSGDPGRWTTGADALVVTGELLGRVPGFFEALDAFSADRAEVTIDCRALRRLDFAAAGELLNRLVTLRTGGKYVVFRDVNQLVAALMAVMGIHDLAELRLRRQ